MTEQLRLTGLEVENILRLRAVSLKLNGDGALVISGRNEQGKSSVLKALEIALAGASGMPADPIHGKAKKGKVIARFDGLTVEKTFSRGKSPSLVVKSADGKKLKSPQTLLATLLNRVALDPIKFMRESPAEQARIITELMGVDLKPLQARRQIIYDARREANRDVKRLEGALASTPFDSALPSEEVSVMALTEELAKRRDHNAEGLDIEGQMTQAREKARNAQREIAAKELEIKKLQVAIDSSWLAKNVLEKQKCALDGESKRLTGKLAAFEPADEDEILKQMASVDESNRAIRSNAAHTKIRSELQKAVLIAEKYQGELDEIEAEEQELRASAESRLPVEGLSIDESGVLYKDKPLAQAGTSAGIIVSVGVAIASNQDSPVRLLLIDDAESLDAKNRRLIVELAHAKGFQVLMCMIGGEGEAQVIIEDGVVATTEEE